MRIIRGIIYYYHLNVNQFRYFCFWKKYSELFKAKSGLEVGGPSRIFAPIYFKCKSCDGVNFNKNTIWWSKGKLDYYKFSFLKLGKIYIADAVDMACIENNSYDFVLSSNNLEHIANPLKALNEFIRVLRPGGALVIIVPAKQYNFDHNREYTTFEHMLEDYKNEIEETDLTHLQEIIKLHDYDMDPLCGGIEAFKKRSALNYENRCLHHHVFSADSLEKIFNYLNVEILSLSERFENYIAICKKKI